jgi:uncharacterized protein
MLDQLISNIRKKLPIQNPLHAFVHNNILQMFEEMDFHDALEEAGKLYRARPYWQIYKYTAKFEEKKIIDSDIFRAIDHYLGKYPATSIIDRLGLTHREYYYRLMFSELSFNDDETQPEIKNNNLWENCFDKMAGKSLTLSRSRTYWRGKEYWEKYHNESYAISIHPLIIRLISSFLDQGQSFWPNPFLSKGFWDFFIFDISSMEGFTTDWTTVLVSKVKTYSSSSPKEVIEQELTKKGIPPQMWEDYLLEILFDLKGWAGMVNKLELEPWQATVKAPKVTLLDYLAAVLLVESAIDTFQSEKNSIDLSMLHGREEKIELKSFQLAIALYQITNSFRLNERWMINICPEELLKIIDEIDLSEHRDRTRLWHEAYEHHFHREAIEAIADHPTAANQELKNSQVLFCIDDREESIRRHLEEIDSMVETFGVVGFFGIDMKFSSVSNKRLIALCPPVIAPSRIIREIPISDAETFKKWNFFRGTSDLGLYYHTRTLFRGFISTLVLGMLSVIPMTVQVFFPQHSKKLRKRMYSIFGKEPETEMQIESSEEGVGYAKQEQAKIVQAVLSMCGISTFSELVILLGHGSSSNNNPFRQAYGCGACGGNAGIPNSRVYAKMANDPLVREEVRKLGINIPESTFFVSGYHDTCTDELFFFNEKEVPKGHQKNFERIRQNLHLAARLNAFERCQRFSSFNPQEGPDAALIHVRERAFDIAQPRPEYGHSSNALAIVSRRDLTKGLYMNRRSFLLSYDWTKDPDGSVLKQVVLGGVPVAVNINLDYYFSAVDNDNFGCGSKLPLNLTSLLGVMTGSQSDLRIGLARQMVEIHEPIRNLTIIEAPLDKVRSLFDGHPRLRNLLYNHWMRLAVKDPVTNKWWIFTQKEFEEISFENKKFKYFGSSMDLLNHHIEDDFAEIKL